MSGEDVEVDPGVGLALDLLPGEGALLLPALRRALDRDDPGQGG